MKTFAVDILMKDENDHSRSFKVYAEDIESARTLAVKRRNELGFVEPMKIHMLNNKGVKMPDTELRFDLMLKGHPRCKTVVIVD